jgi:hypothetical protein
MKSAGEDEARARRRIPITKLEALSRKKDGENRGKSFFNSLRDFYFSDYFEHASFSSRICVVVIFTSTSFLG